MVNSLFFSKVALLVDNKQGNLFFIDIVEVLKNYNIDVSVVNLLAPDFNLFDKLFWNKFTQVFIAIDSNNPLGFGYIQTILDLINLPYTGCGMLAATLAGNRIKTKKIWQAYGIATPFFIKCNLNNTIAINWQEIISLIGFPLIIKPVFTNDNRIIKVCNMEQLNVVYDKFHNLKEIIVEPWIVGEKYLIYILADQALLPLNSNLAENIYELHDYDIHNMQQLAMTAYKVLDCVGFAEITIIKDLSGDFWVSNINIMPEFFSNSNFVLAAENSGISFSQLIDQILLTSLINKESHIKTINTITNGIKDPGFNGNG